MGRASWSAFFAPRADTGWDLGPACRKSALVAAQVLESAIMQGSSSMTAITCPACGHNFQEAAKRLLDNLSVVAPGAVGRLMSCSTRTSTGVNRRLRLVNYR